MPATLQRANTMKDLLHDAPRVKDAIAAKGTQYFGACVIQAPGAWSRIGPTWLVPNVGWVTYGPGLKRWGTTKGLAEVAAECEPAPEWHAEGWTISPEPNLVFPVSNYAIGGNKNIARVKELTEQADELAES